MKSDYVIVRSDGAGVFAGYLLSMKKDVAILKNARWLWYWAGAASLSDLAVNGVSKPKECKFPPEVKKIKVLRVIQVLSVTKKAKNSIANVPEWTEHVS